MNDIYSEIESRLRTVIEQVNDCNHMVRGRLRDKHLGNDDYPTVILDAMEEAIDSLDYALVVHRRLRDE